MSGPLIEVEGLRHHYDDGTAALDEVDFRLEEGESVALLGANGSGESTVRIARGFAGRFPAARELRFGWRDAAFAVLAGAAIVLARAAAERLA